MYNEALKKRFISYADASKSKYNKERYYWIFNTTEAFEYRMGKDLYDFADDEIGLVLRNGFSESSTLPILKKIKSYIEWANKSLETGIQDEPSVQDDVYEDYIRHTLVANPLQTKIYMDKIYGLATQYNLNNTFRCYLWMGFSGINEKDAMQVKGSDIDFLNACIYVNGKEYCLYPESIPEFKSCAFDDAFYIDTGMYEKKLYPRAAGSKIIRWIKTDDVKLKNVRDRVVRLCTDALNEGRCDFKFTYRRMVKSGELYRLYETECAMGTLPPKYILNHGVNRVDYENWKRVFHNK